MGCIIKYDSTSIRKGIEKIEFSKAWLEFSIKKQVSIFKLSNDVIKRNKELLLNKEINYQQYINKF